MIMGRNFSLKRVAVELLVLVGLAFLATLFERAMPPGEFRHILQFLILSGAPAPWVFIFIYRLFPWRQTEIGRALMTIMTTFAVYYSFAVYSILFGMTPPAFRAVLYLLVAYAVWRMVGAVFSSRRRALRRQRAERVHASLPAEAPYLLHRRSTDL